MRIPNATHESRPWVISRIAPDFRLLDAWALPVQGARDDRDAALEMLTSFDPAGAGSRMSRLLFRLRLRLGALLGWDDPATARPIPGCRETSLRARLPARLCAAAVDTTMGDALRRIAGGFTPIYRTQDEWAAEISNATVHGVLHLAWVAQPGGAYRAHMGVYVKPRGALGRAYLLLIEPFRRFVVYPALIRAIARAWEARTAGGPPSVQRARGAHGDGGQQRMPAATDVMRPSSSRPCRR
jgi:hypothetical protein